MANKENLKKFNKLGESLIRDVSFYRNHQDVLCEPKKGIFPRGLIYEEIKRKGKGSIIVGLNPGSAKKKEREALKKSPRYKTFFDYWNTEISAMPYYQKLRMVMDDVGLTGPILWTELAKCESKKNGKLYAQTVKEDINRHLRKEIEVVPEEWPIIGVGKVAYVILSYLYPERLVIGMPHPTGSYGHFAEIYDSRKEKLRDDIRKKLRSAIKSKKSTALFKTDYL
ncbi:MAG: hypothetical protein M1334_04495 [Patescibacteria group bacterium]|nr:hypothetical protein [Patescibacteria group bacterium]